MKQKKKRNLIRPLSPYYPGAGASRPRCRKASIPPSKSTGRMVGWCPSFLAQVARINYIELVSGPSPTGRLWPQMLRKPATCEKTGHPYPVFAQVASYRIELVSGPSPNWRLWPNVAKTVCDLQENWASLQYAGDEAFSGEVELEGGRAPHPAL